MWRTSRGLDVARRLALRECSYLESGRLPAYLMAYETLRQSALTGPPSSEQDHLLWRTMEVAHADFLKGKVGPGSLTPLFFLYKGQNVFGAFGIPNAFAPETRAHLGYLLGMRYLRLAGTQGAGRRTEAVAFFRTALKTAEPGSMLQRELAKELAKLK